VTGDWNGDGRTKVGVFFGAGTWWLDANGNGKWDGAAVDFSSIYGQTGDTPVTGKWTVGGPSLPNSLNINNTGLSTGHAGAGAQTFTFNYRDISGAANIQSGQVEFIDGTPAGNPRCSFQWQRPNILNIYATGASTSTLGTAISDGFCSVALTSIVNSPTDPYAVAVTASITFLQDYPGLYGTQTYGVLTQVNDVSGFRTSWGQVGTWTVDQVPIGPFSGTGSTQTFTLSAADPNGQSYTNINNVQLIFNWAPYQSDACYLNYDAVNDLLFLADVTGNFSVFSPISLKNPGGTLGDLVTSNCQVIGSASTITGSGASLYLNLKLNFKSTFIGQQNTFVAVSDTLANSPPVQVGTWTAYPAPTGSGPTSILPSGVNNDGTGTITFTYDDPNGFNYVPGMHIQIGQTFDDPGNCRLVYLRGTGQTNHAVWVYYDTWSAYVGAGYVGQPGVTISSPNRCTVDLGASTFGENGTRGALNLAVNLQNANASGKVTVWMRPFDRQSVVSPNWAANPSPAFPIATDDFSLGPVSAVTAQQTQTQGFTVPVGVFGKFAGTVTFTCAAPGSVTIACSGPVSTSGTAPYTAAFSVTPSAAASGGNIVITATSGALSHRITIPLNVTASPLPPDITFSGSQMIQVGPNGSATFSLSVTPINGWTAPVTLHTFNALTNFDFCPLVNGSCFADPIRGNDITITTLPATVYFKVTARTGATGQATFAPSITSPAPARTTGVSFTMQVVGGTPPASFTLSAPTQITVPVGGTAPASVSVTQQGGYTGTVAVTASSGIASFAPNQLTLGAGTPTAQTTATFAAGSRGPGVYTETISAGGTIQPVQVTIRDSGITNAPLTITSDSTSADTTYSDGVSRTYHYFCHQGPDGGLCSAPIPKSCDANDPNITAEPAYYTGSEFRIKYTAVDGATIGDHSVTCIFTDKNVSGATLRVMDKSVAPVITSVCYQGVTASNCEVSAFPVGSDGHITINGTNLTDPNTNTTPQLYFDASIYFVHGYVTSATPTRLDATVRFTPNASPGTYYKVSVYPVGVPSTLSGLYPYLKDNKIGSNQKSIQAISNCAAPTVTITSRPITIAASFSRPGTYEATLTSTVSATGGVYEWSSDNPGMVGFLSAQSGPGANSVTLGIISTNDKVKVTLRYTAPCGAIAYDSFTFALSNDTTAIAWIDSTAIDAFTLSQAVASATPSSSVFDLNSPPLCSLTVGKWAALGQNGVGRGSNGLTDLEISLANTLILQGSSNPLPPSSLSDTNVLKSSQRSYKLYQRFQAYYEVVGGLINSDSFKTLQTGAVLGVTEDPCFGLLGFSAESALDNSAIGVSAAKDFVFQLNEGRKAKPGQYTDQFLNGASTTPDLAQAGPATPYIWSVVQFDANGKTRTLHPGTVNDNASAFPTFWMYSGTSLLFTLPQGSVEPFSNFDSNYRYFH